MARRADALAELRALDERLAAVAPGPHLEARILARVRGEKAKAPSRAGWLKTIERAKRPALVLSFGLAAALAVLLSLEARVSGPLPRSAEVEAPEGRRVEEPAAASDPAEHEAEGPAPASPTGREVEEGPQRPLFNKERTPRQEGPAREAPPNTKDKYNDNDKYKEFPLDWGPTREVEDKSAPPASPALPRRAPTDPFLQNPLPGSSFGPMWFPGEKGGSEQESRLVRLFGSRRSEPWGGSPSNDAETPITTTNDAPAAPPEEIAEEACKSYSDWKTLAHAECVAEGLVLEAFTPLAPCGGDFDLYGGAEAKCAKPANEVNEDDPGYCEGLMVGDGTSCEPPEHWKKLAYDTCLANGLNLVDIFFHQDCSDGESTAAKVLCCKNVPPPEPDPAPSPCVTVEVYPACSPVNEVEAEAKEQCAAQGMGLTAFKFAPDCEDGGVSLAAFMCCP